MGIIGLLLMPFLDILGFAVNIYFKIVAVDIILYWLLHYKIVTVHNKYAEKFMEILKLLTEPVYKLIRKKVAPISGYDIAPYVLLLAIAFVGSFITHLNVLISRYMM
ncbi:MAG: YggT family protein [Alphaproteobacteria bacterium]|nr:YggT family protein [Alphaproteobacteria bacterium]